MCICVRFNQGFLLSQQTIRKLSHIVPKSPLVRNYVNFYRYMTGRVGVKSNLKLLTQFPDEGDIQQQYQVDSKMLTKEDDVVAMEMYLSDFRDLSKLIETLRSEWKHASLWESILAICESSKGEQKEVNAVDMQLVLRRTEFFLQFDTDYGSMTSELKEPVLEKVGNFSFFGFYGFSEKKFDFFSRKMVFFLVFSDQKTKKKTKFFRRKNSEICSK